MSKQTEHALLRDESETAFDEVAALAATEAKAVGARAAEIDRMANAFEQDELRQTLAL